VSRKGQTIPNTLTPDHLAIAIIRSAAILNVDPLKVFEKGPRHHATRCLAAVALAASEIARPANAARAVGLGRYAASFSYAATLKVTRPMAERVRAALLQAFPEAPSILPPPVGQERPRVEPRRFVGDICGRLEGPLPDAAPIQPLNSRRASATVGKPKPGGKQPDLSCEPGLLAAVQALRAKHTPWPHISIQLNKPVISLRRAFDPDFVEG
jgi:hypothetical protein